MKISINSQWVNIPSSVSEITLKQRIDFQNTHGKELDAMANSIAAMEDGYEKDLESAQFQFEQMFRTFSFFANTTVEAIKESEFIDKIASIYYSCLGAMFSQPTELQTEFVWNNETWVLNHPEIKNGSRMMFGEFIDAKQIIQDMVGLGNNKWECMLPLAAIFLRKKDEEYNQSFLYEGSERLKLMESLPLDIALNVGFFLNSSLNLFIQAFQSSVHQELKEEAIT